MAKTAADILAIARKEVGYSRYDDPEQGTKYGRWYAKKMGSPYFGTTGVPYCAMFVSWCLDQGGVSCLGCPTAGCTSGLLVPARRAGKLIRVEDCKAGDLALFNWTSAGFYASEADHVGFVTANSKGSKTVSTIEGNVSGAVMTRTRSYSTVVGCIRPNYAAEPTPEPEPTPSPNLVVDGVFGAYTVKALQTALQTHGFYKGYYLDGSFGYYSKLELQKYLRKLGYYTTAYLLDGDFGTYSVKALQAYLRKLGYYTDAYLLDGDWGRYTTMALQRALNANKF